MNNYKMFGGRNPIAGFSGLLTLLLCVYTTTVHAETYVGISTVQVEIGGTMDGVSFLSGGGSIEIMPKQETATGQKFSIGSYDGDALTEFSVVMSDHDGVWVGIPTESEYFALSWDGKFAFTEWAVRPTLILGLAYTSVTVKGGSTDGFITDDAKFKGFDFRFGAGLLYQPLDSWLIDFNIVQRYGSYNGVDGVSSGSVGDDVDIDGDGLSTELGLKYIF